jgi:hypothetical protein
MGIIMIDFLCVDCGFDTLFGHEYYMVTDDVWLGAGMKKSHKVGDGMLCIGCLEHRIGRQLVPEDFPNYPINRGVFIYSDRLYDRLGATWGASNVSLSSL